jgi:hypothetical protein
LNNSFIHRGKKVIINGESFNFELFLLLEPSYTLSENETGRIYEHGRKHYTITKDNRQIPQPLNWMDGNRYIARINDIRMLLKEQTLNENREKERIKNLKR